MSVLSDIEIRKRCLPDAPGGQMITPFQEGVYQQGVISYGLGTAGYDIRLGTRYKVLKSTACVMVDPKRFGNLDYAEGLFDEFDACSKTGQVWIPPDGFILGISLESFAIPDDLMGVAIGKSTFARIGVHVYITPLENGWSGKLVIEISNTGPLPACVYAHEGIAQILFHPIVGEIGNTYRTKDAGRPGKYQDQTGITTARV
jgi:dCTP deaminase